jgi:glycosyltransferase involved in cell wall biosynthesis
VRWHIISGEYPPQPGGVADYTRLVAHGLAQAGDEVHVWAPQCGRPMEADSLVHVHRLPGHFGPRALITLDRVLAQDPRGRVLLQYVPHAFGLKAMNLPLCWWLYSRRHWNIDVMFHEVAFQRRTAQPLRHNLLGEVTSLMAKLVARSAQRIFVASMAWERTLRRLVPNLGEIEWLPIPSSIPSIDNSAMAAGVRARYARGILLVGHFGTYGAPIRVYLERVLPTLVQSTNVSVLLMGRRSLEFRDSLLLRCPSLAPVIHATGELEPASLSHHISACDLMIQPYPDGVSARRSSAMVTISHGRATVTTLGDLTEEYWRVSGGVSLVSADAPDSLLQNAVYLLEDAPARNQLGQRARELYKHLFDLPYTLQKLRMG